MEAVAEAYRWIQYAFVWGMSLVFLLSLWCVASYAYYYFRKQRR